MQGYFSKFLHQGVAKNQAFSIWIFTGASNTPPIMKTIKNSLIELIDFATVEVKEGETILYITQLTGKGVLITVDNIDYFRNHLMMDPEMWENFLYRFTHDKGYRISHVVNKRWHGSLSA